jgi:methionyl-tRNA formyltransferase
LPALVGGTAPRRPQAPGSGSYFGGRRPEDGIIDWSRDAVSIHNLVRAVAPPYPGAWTTVGGVPARVLRSRVADPAAPPASSPALEAIEGRLIARCGGGGALAVLALELAGTACNAPSFAARFGGARAPLGTASGKGSAHV